MGELRGKVGRQLLGKGCGLARHLLGLLRPAGLHQELAQGEAPMGGDLLEHRDARKVGRQLLVEVHGAAIAFLRFGGPAESLQDLGIFEVNTGQVMPVMGACGEIRGELLIEVNRPCKCFSASSGRCVASTRASNRR